MSGMIEEIEERMRRITERGAQVGVGFPYLAQAAGWEHVVAMTARAREGKRVFVNVYYFHDFGDRGEWCVFVTDDPCLLHEELKRRGFCFFDISLPKQWMKCFPCANKGEVVKAFEAAVEEAIAIASGLAGPSHRREEAWSVAT
jgi:hypothetical protein